MKSRYRSSLLSAVCLLPCCLPVLAAGQTGQSSFATVPAFRVADGINIRQAVKTSKPFTVTGARGAVLGVQTGVVELWQFPVKVFSDLHLTAELDGYPVAIDLNSNAAELEVHPGHTILTYSHAAITVRQHMLVAPALREGEATDVGHDAGALMYFEIESTRAATLTISFRPEMKQQWPAPQYGSPGASWIPLGTGGAYTIGTDNPALFGMVAMPNATPGMIPPYQEHPQTLPLQFRVRYEPDRDRGRLFPLLSAVAQPGEVNNAAGIAKMTQRLFAQSAALEQTSHHIDDYYAEFLRTRMRAHTPDAAFDAALAWAEMAIEEAQVETRTAAGSETGLVAGWFPSFDSTRPGFGWYFGRDTLWSLYAIDSYGDRTLARRALEFLMRRQRADGKMMHEYSLSAPFLTGATAWSNFPYEYAAADGTPLFLLAMEDYLRSTGDVEFLRAHWAEVKLAWHFESTSDSDGDGVYDNAQGTGWVEQWSDPLPHQELYLASLDRAASSAMQRLSTLMGDSALASQAEKRAGNIATVIETYRQPNGLYAFSRRSDRSFETTKTIYPSVALWHPQPSMQQPGPMLTLWSSSLVSTDWGSRAVASDDPVFDPMTYHQGSVWPLFTGWNALAQYRSGRPLAGYAALRQNVNLTWAEDPGSVTEVLSGRFYQAMGRSSTHQLWSSAMTLAPAARGLFGLDPDALHHTLHLHPHLPVTWQQASVENVRIGDVAYRVDYHRDGTALEVSVTSPQPSVLCIDAAFTTDPCPAAAVKERHLRIALPAVEVGLHVPETPLPGDETHLPRVIDEHYDVHRSEFRLEALAGSTVLLDVRVEGRLEAEPRPFIMPAGSGFVQTSIVIEAERSRSKEKR